MSHSKSLTTRISISRKDLGQLEADLAVCFAHEGDKTPRGVEDPRLKRELSAQMKAEGFKGEPGDQLVWNADGRYASRRFLIFGVGPTSRPADEILRRAAARASRAAAAYSARSLAIRMPSLVDPAAGTRAVTEGALLGAYNFDRYLTDPHRRSTRLETIEIGAESTAAPIKRAMVEGELGARAVCLARDLVNEAPSRMTPQVMARLAQKEARSARLQCKVLGPAEIKKAKMGALLAVSRGADEPPRVVHLAYKPRGAAKKRRKILLVGKGVTFDSGGLNLKPTGSMETMKMDMAGAGAVLATMTALDKLGCADEVHAYLGLVENMTGGAAYKPGDVLDTCSGKTVEVWNTDAEGRLVLCDLLAHGAKTLKPTHVVDLATLTGACVVALGPSASGLFTRHDDLRDELVGAGKASGEKLWPLPLYDEYLQMLQKGPADLRNVGSRWGGAITAALFLGEFLPREIPWAHLDIAGPAFADNEAPDMPQGGTGAGVLTLLRWLGG